MNQDEIAALIAAKNAGLPLQDSGAASTTADDFGHDYSELDPVIGAAGEVPMSMLMDLTLPVSIELGRTTMSVQEILQLGRGSVVQLERLAGEPIDIYVGDRRFAEGEVVVLGENFGVRVTRIVSRANGPELVG
ncbi:MAG TPA: flagellar motor switch protein FliN [Gemmatimonadaceae bacterium]|nr:flagellar motor switch protein FliN [Gemmatimonadaceae bacterium]